MGGLKSWLGFAGSMTGTGEKCDDSLWSEPSAYTHLTALLKVQLFSVIREITSRGRGGTRGVAGRTQ